MCASNYFTVKRFDRVIAKLKWCSFFPDSVLQSVVSHKRTSSDIGRSCSSASGLQNGSSTLQQTSYSVSCLRVVCIQRVQSVYFTLTSPEVMLHIHISASLSCTQVQTGIAALRFNYRMSRHNAKPGPNDNNLLINSHQICKINTSVYFAACHCVFLTLVMSGWPTTQGGLIYDHFYSTKM